MITFIPCAAVLSCKTSQSLRKDHTNVKSSKKLEQLVYRLTAIFFGYCFTVDFNFSFPQI